MIYLNYLFLQHFCDFFKTYFVPDKRQNAGTRMSDNRFDQVVSEGQYMNPNWRLVSGSSQDSGAPRNEALARIISGPGQEFPYQSW
jgi:hypothetical protein